MSWSFPLDSTLREFIRLAYCIRKSFSYRMLNLNKEYFKFHLDGLLSSCPLDCLRILHSANCVINATWCRRCQYYIREEDSWFPPSQKNQEEEARYDDMKWKNKRSQLARNLQLFSNIIMLKFNPLSLLLHLLLPVLENMSQCYRRDVRKCTFCTTFIDSHIAHHISPLTDNVERM